jgi:hypothetical protein
LIITIIKKKIIIGTLPSFSSPKNLSSTGIPFYHVTSFHPAANCYPPLPDELPHCSQTTDSETRLEPAVPDTGLFVAASIASIAGLASAGTFFSNFQTFH